MSDDTLSEDEAQAFRERCQQFLAENATGISVEGGVCTTVDNSFSRGYVLKVGPATYGVFLLSRQLP